MLSPVEYEVVNIVCKPIPFPVKLDMPDDVRDTLPRASVKQIEGIRLLRFYACPVSGDIVEFKNHLWVVQCLSHTCEVKGSNKPDRLPVVLTKYLGSV